MADDHQVTRVTSSPPAAPPRPQRAPESRDDPEAARAEIEATRARMSETIDEIEDVLLQKKEKIQEQLDVLAPVREDPVRTLGMIFGAALALGFLTAGSNKRKSYELPRLTEPMEPLDDFEDEDEFEDTEAAIAWERAETWEDRAHRLLRIAKAQEAELDIHRARRDSLLRQLRFRRGYDEEADDELEEPNLFDRIRETATEKLSGLASDISHRMMRGS